MIYDLNVVGNRVFDYKEFSQEEIYLNGELSVIERNLGEVMQQMVVSKVGRFGVRKTVQLEPAEYKPTPDMGPRTMATLLRPKKFKHRNEVRLITRSVLSEDTTERHMNWETKVVSDHNGFLHYPNQEALSFNLDPFENAIGLLRVAGTLRLISFVNGQNPTSISEIMNDIHKLIPDNI